MRVAAGTIENSGSFVVLLLGFSGVLKVIMRVYMPAVIRFGDQRVMVTTAR